MRLIQAPTPSASCTAGDAGVAAGGMDTDGAGSATLTLQDTVFANTTGVWVFVEHLSQNSQTPAEYYTSAFIAAI